MPTLKEASNPYQAELKNPPLYLKMDQNWPGSLHLFWSAVSPPSIPTDQPSQEDRISVLLCRTVYTHTLLAPRHIFFLGLNLPSSLPPSPVFHSSCLKSIDLSAHFLFLSRLITISRKTFQCSLSFLHAHMRMCTYTHTRACARTHAQTHIDLFSYPCGDRLFISVGKTQIPRKFSFPLWWSKKWFPHKQ